MQVPGLWFKSLTLKTCAESRPSPSRLPSRSRYGQAGRNRHAPQPPFYDSVRRASRKSSHSWPDSRHPPTMLASIAFTHTTDEPPERLTPQPKPCFPPPARSPSPSTPPPPLDKPAPPHRAPPPQSSPPAERAHLHPSAATPRGRPPVPRRVRKAHPADRGSSPPPSQSPGTGLAPPASSSARPPPPALPPHTRSAQSPSPPPPSRAAHSTPTP